MPTFGRPPRYHIYLLTIWEERGAEVNGEVVWRFRLEDPSTGQKSGFADLKAFVKALEQKISQSK